MNIDKQVAYWKDSASSNIETAEILLNKDKYTEGLFFCHLAIEKILKAHYVKHNNALAPKSHKLQYLAEQSSIELTETQKDFFSVLMQYQIEGRYPDFYPPYPTHQTAIKLLDDTKQTMIWLIQKL
jgi:HEPN domain-containing protein